MMNPSGPTLYSFPQVKDADTFERLVRDCLAKKYGRSFEQYGNKGQKQHGIDLWSSDKKYVVQCKNYFKYKRADFKKVINADYVAAIKHFECDKTFIVATALSRSTEIQEFVDLISLDEMPIEVLFWEDIEELLSENPDISRTYFPNFHNDLPVKPQLDRPIWWVDFRRDETGYWFNDRYPFLLDSFLLTAAGRGVIFLISDWPGGIGTALNELAEKEKLSLTWGELPLGRYADLSPKDSGTVLTIRDNPSGSAEQIKQCIHRWMAEGFCYQLIFNFCVPAWLTELAEIRRIVKDLKSEFLGLSFDLISTLDPFLSADGPERDVGPAAEAFLADLAAGKTLPAEENLIEQVHAHPEQCHALLRLAVRFKTLQPVIFSFASHSFTALGILLDELGVNAVSDLLMCGLLSGRQPDWDLCAWEFYRRCCSGLNEWEFCRSFAEKQCSDVMCSLIAGAKSQPHPPAQTKQLFYLLKRASEKEIKDYLDWYEPSSLPYLAILLCSRYAFDTLTEKLRDPRLAEQYRAIMIPNPLYEEDEMTESNRSAVRPIL